MTGRPTGRIASRRPSAEYREWPASREGRLILATIPKHLNRPGTSEELQRLGRAGTSLTVEHERYSELGARISWLRAGYLALVAMEGYKIVLDPAMDIVRTQIRECDERRMLTFVADAQETFPSRYDAFSAYLSQHGTSGGPCSSVPTLSIFHPVAI